MSSLWPNKFVQSVVFVYLFGCVHFIVHARLLFRVAICTIATDNGVNDMSLYAMSTGTQPLNALKITNYIFAPSSHERLNIVLSHDMALHDIKQMARISSIYALCSVHVYNSFERRQCVWEDIHLALAHSSLARLY